MKPSPHLPRVKEIESFLEKNKVKTLRRVRRASDYCLKLWKVSFWDDWPGAWSEAGLDQEKILPKLTELLEGFKGLDIYYKNGWMQVVVKDLD